jgi:hypothetical protein
MRTFLALGLAAAVMAPALAAAQGRPQTLRMTCGQTQQLVARAGGIVLGTGGHTYDRYVYHRGFCQPTEILKQRWVPTRDTGACPLYTCIEPSGDDWFWGD